MLHVPARSIVARPSRPEQKAQCFEKAKLSGYKASFDLLFFSRKVQANPRAGMAKKKRRSAKRRKAKATRGQPANDTVLDPLLDLEIPSHLYEPIFGPDFTSWMLFDWFVIAGPETISGFFTSASATFLIGTNDGPEVPLQLAIDHPDCPEAQKLDAKLALAAWQKLREAKRGGHLELAIHRSIQFMLYFGRFLVQRYERDVKTAHQKRKALHDHNISKQVHSSQKNLMLHKVWESTDPHLTDHERDVATAAIINRDHAGRHLFFPKEISFKMVERARKQLGQGSMRSSRSRRRS